MVLMMTLVNEKQPFTLRTSVLYCYECFLYQNQEFQAQLIETLLPKDSETEGFFSYYLLIFLNFVFLIQFFNIEILS